MDEIYLQLELCSSSNISPTTSSRESSLWTHLLSSMGYKDTNHSNVNSLPMFLIGSFLMFDPCWWYEIRSAQELHIFTTSMYCCVTSSNEQVFLKSPSHQLRIFWKVKHRTRKGSRAVSCLSHWSWHYNGIKHTTTLDNL